MPRKIHLDRPTRSQRVRKGRREESRDAKRAYRKSRNTQYVS